MPGDPPAPSTRLVLVYGGCSAEHEVSCISARHVLDAVDRRRYDVAVLGVGLDGRWVDATQAVAGPEASSDNAPVAGAGLPSPGELHLPEADALRALAGGAPAATVVFPLIHGPMGEDGTLQGLLEVAGLAYVGSGVLGSAIAMDKGVAKALLGAAGLPQVRYLVLRTDEIGEDTGGVIEQSLGWPVFVKPANLGSTIGISRAEGPEALPSSLALALRYDEYVVIEEQVAAREIELGVVGHVLLAVTEPGEPLPSREFYDFEDKYLMGTAGLAIPASLPASVATEAKDLALRACRALRVEGMARVDLFYEEEGRGLLVNEINTVPGFTAISMYPMLWRAAGADPAMLIDALVAAARSRHDRRRRFETTR
ncbi:MAG: D-alanine--D-alanine ligase [Actinomycetota bacterium]|nr:D-alanine--D-alanine ligase [Actinomycetota bacterium]MDQ6946872.1 D-alanine--D-alanine ligase [Actinomycetota bacterium]